MNHKNVMNTFDHPVIRASEISKHYKLYKRPADRLKEVVFRKPYHQLFASLEDISFDVYKGECLGIIGENGAGKSTLLKILAQALTPTKGTLSITGRIGALLELGAGFHPELSGRQNYYMTAALMGMSKKEIIKSEKNILSFAEIGDFIDQPVKTYSSGMAVRLGFSIATSINPDILIIDEALSVGDEYFQKKSLDRLRQFRENGKTIIFCSHSLYYVNLLCNRVMWLNKGEIELCGDSETVSTAYSNKQREKQAKLQNSDSVSKSPKITSPKKISEIIILSNKGNREISFCNDLNIEVKINSNDNQPFSLGVGIRRNDGITVNLVNLKKLKNLLIQGEGVHKIRIVYPKLPLLKGKYSIIAFIIDEHGLHIYDRQFSNEFEIVQHANYKHELGLSHLDLEVVDAKYE